MRKILQRETDVSGGDTNKNDSEESFLWIPAVLLLFGLLLLALLLLLFLLLLLLIVFHNGSPRFVFELILCTRLKNIPAFAKYLSKSS